MAAGCVIGVDLGGTKLLAGTVDSKLEGASPRLPSGRGTDDAGALIDQLVEAVAGGRSRACIALGGWRWGFGIPCSGRSVGTGVAPPTPTTCRCTGVAVGATCSPSASACRWPSTTTATRRCWPSGGWGEARGAKKRDHADARHRHRRRACSSMDALVARLARRGVPSSATSSSTPTGPPCPGNCPNHGCLEALVSGHAIGARGGCGSRARIPTGALGQALDSGARRSPARSSPSWPMTTTRRRPISMTDDGA